MYFSPSGYSEDCAIFSVVDLRNLVDDMRVRGVPPLVNVTTLRAITLVELPPTLSSRTSTRLW